MGRIAVVITLLAVLFLPPAPSAAPPAAVPESTSQELRPEEEIVLEAATYGPSYRIASGGNRPKLLIGSSLFPLLEGPAGDADFSIDAYTAAGYDAVNLSAEDVKRGRERLPELIRKSVVPFLSVTFPGAKRFIVKQCGKVRAGVVGFDGTREGEKALRTAIEEARKECDLLVLLAHMPRDRAVPLCKRVPGVDLCLVPAGPLFDPEPLRIGGTWHVMVPRGGDTVAKVALTWKDKSLAGVASEYLRPKPFDPKKLEALRKKHRIRPVEEEIFAEPGPARDTPRPMVPARLEAGKTHGLRRTAGSRAVKFTLRSVALQRRYGGLKGAFLVLDTRWRNTLPLAFVYDRKLGTHEYRVPDLRDHLYLVIDRSRLARLRPDAGSLPGHLPVSPFRLERIGSEASGNLLFELPSLEPHALELRFYDYAHGHFTIPILGAPIGKEGALHQPVIPPRKNEVVEIGIFRVRKTETWGPRKAPDGETFVEIDLRGHSLVTRDVDATAFDPAARKGQTIRSGSVADWKEFRKYLHLVVDGEYAYGALPDSDLPEEPRFLPDVKTGGTVAFRVPAKYASLELRCDFPNAAVPGGKRIRPKPIVFSLEGKRPRPSGRKPIAEIKDGSILVAIVGKVVSEEFAGRKPGKGSKFLILDARVSARESEFFQTNRQIRYVTDAGGRVGPHPATWTGPRRPSDIVWVPAEESRSFQVVFEIPEGDRRLRLAYAGYTKAETVELGRRGAARACPKCKEPVEAGDAFCQGCGAKLKR